MLFVGGYDFLDPPPQIGADGGVAGPSDGARKLNARTAFFYPYTGITPAMCMRIPGIASQYLITMRSGDGEYLDGGRFGVGVLGRPGCSGRVWRWVSRMA
jgi:hypothetical protein